MIRQNPVVIVMAKSPTPGTVKTRLTPSLTPEAAATLAAAFLQDVVGNVRQTEVAVLIAHAPPEGRPHLESLLPPGLHWTPQRGRDLGERMDGAMADAQTMGFGPLIVIGTDSPTLPLSHIRQAVSALKSAQAELVLGPTEDGGYSLVGTDRHRPGLFDDIVWSTDRVFEQTMHNAARLGLRSTTLPRWYDIDTPDDLRLLRREVSVDRALGERVQATSAWLRAHPDISPSPPEAVHRQTSA